MQIAFIGLGEMGLPMASHLLEACPGMLVSSASGRAFPALERLGARPTHDRRALADCCTVFLCLPNDTVVEEVLFSAQGLPSWVSLFGRAGIGHGPVRSRCHVDRDVWRRGAGGRRHAALPENHGVQRPAHGACGQWSVGLPLPVLTAATTTYQTALLQGHGHLDKGAMIKVFETLLGVHFRSPEPQLVSPRF